MSSRIQMRRGTAAAWTAANPVLLAGEPGFETDTRKEKRGDGVTAWNSLPYPVGYDPTSGSSYGMVGDGSTNNLTTFQAAIAANVNGVIRLPAGTFLVDNGASGTALTFTGTNLTIIGAGRDATIIKLGPNGANAQGFALLGITNNQSLTLQNLTLQGPDTIGGTGPPTDPGITGGTSFNYLFNDISTTPGSVVRMRDCHTKNFVFQGLHTASTDAVNTLFEGYGSAYRSMGPQSGDDGTSGYAEYKYFRCVGCTFQNFGDPTGNKFYHSLYIGTSHDIYLDSCTFGPLTATATGNVAQHYDTNVAFANAGKHAEYIDCLFYPVNTQGGIVTSYNCPTKIIGCTFHGFTNQAIDFAGPLLVDSCTFTLTAANAAAVYTTGQGQSTGLDWGLQMSNCRVKFVGAVAAYGVQILVANGASGTSLGSEFIITDSVFEGDPSGNGIYIFSNETGGRINVRGCTFLDHPSVAIRNVGTNVVTIDGCHFLMSAGLAIYQTVALTELALYRSEFASGIGITLSTQATMTRSEGNYGAGWTVRNVQNANYTVLPTDEVVGPSATGSVWTYTLPAASSVPAGKRYIFKDFSGAAGTNHPVISRAGADTIDGATTQSISTNYGKLIIESNGSNGWDIIG